MEGFLCREADIGRCTTLLTKMKARAVFDDRGTLADGYLV